MKLLDILTKLYETTSIEANEEDFSNFINSLELKDLEKMKEFGRELLELADYHIEKWNISYRNTDFKGGK